MSHLSPITRYYQTYLFHNLSVVLLVITFFSWKYQTIKIITMFQTSNKRKNILFLSNELNKISYALHLLSHFGTILILFKCSGD